MQTKLFRSPAIGVSFRYPASWSRAGTDQSGASGQAVVMFAAKSLPLPVLTISVESPAVLVGKKPGPFRDAEKAELQQALKDGETGPQSRVLASGFVRIDGLRLSGVESVDHSVSAAGKQDDHRVELASSMSISPTLTTSTYDAVIVVPQQAWDSERDTILAVLASMRFSTPRPPR